MIVESQDKGFYRNPTWMREDWAVVIDDDHCHFLSLKRYKPETIQKRLREAGFSVSVSHDEPEFVRFIFDAHKMVNAHKVGITIRKPVPIPKSHEGRLIEPDKRSGEPCMSFGKSSKNTGRTSGSVSEKPSPSKT